jgi:hypothetical protein
MQYREIEDKGADQGNMYKASGNNQVPTVYLSDEAC